jgi:hypothetical protein
MLKHVGSSQVKGDNLGLMQFGLGPDCILMGGIRETGVLEARLERWVDRQ